MRIYKFILGILFLLSLFVFLTFIFNTDNYNLGHGFVYNSEHKHIIGKIDIPPKIISYSFDDYFIVAKQKPNEIHNNIYDKREYVYPLGRNNEYYWLIIKHEKKVFGPLDYISYQKLRMEYKVSKKLILK